MILYMDLYSTTEQITFRSTFVSPDSLCFFRQVDQQKSGFTFLGLSPRILGTFRRTSQ